MWVSIIFYAIVSLFIIYISHQTWTYITQSFIKKKYIVSSQIDKYKSIIRELQESSSIPVLEDTTDLQMDLEEFLKEI